MQALRGMGHANSKRRVVNDSSLHYTAITDGTGPDTWSQPLQHHPPFPDVVHCSRTWTLSLQLFHQQHPRSWPPIRWQRGQLCLLATKICQLLNLKAKRGNLPQKHGNHGSPSPLPHPPQRDRPSCPCSSSAHA